MATPKVLEFRQEILLLPIPRFSIATQPPMSTNPPPTRLDRIEATLELLAQHQIQFQELLAQRQIQFQEQMEQRQTQFQDQFQEQMNQFREQIEQLEQRQNRFQEQLEQTQAQLDRQIPVIADLRVAAEALLQTAEQDRDDILVLATFLRRHTSDGHSGQ
jgi:uncharacterized protein YhaN